MSTDLEGSHDLGAMTGPGPEAQLWLSTPSLTHLKVFPDSKSVRRHSLVQWALPVLSTGSQRRAGSLYTSGGVERVPVRLVTRLTANGIAAESSRRGCTLSPSHATSREKNDSPQHRVKKKDPEPLPFPETGALVLSETVNVSYDTVSPVLIPETMKS